mmetsp:Transcript_51976/g.105719  ORF Transcript_51976/g.105719 Transcript_51976/m.105719 type:complete len:131 (+) Transcript_51976:178-570(+)
MVPGGALVLLGPAVFSDCNNGCERAPSGTAPPLAGLATTMGRPEGPRKGRLVTGSKASCACCAALREALDTQDDEVPIPGSGSSSNTLGLLRKGSSGDLPGNSMGAGPSPSAHAHPTGGGEGPAGIRGQW